MNVYPGTPALAYANWASSRIRKLPKAFAISAKLVLAVLVIFNLFYFGGILLAGESEAKNKLLFCF